LKLENSLLIGTEELQELRLQIGINNLFRLSNLDVKMIRSLVNETYWDRDISLAAWGSLHSHTSNSNNVMTRVLKRSTLG